MPLLQIQTSSQVTGPGGAVGLIKTLSAALAKELGKPESYVMVAFESDAVMLFAGTSEPACFAALKNIGSFSPAQTERLSALLCTRLSEALNVPVISA